MRGYNDHGKYAIPDANVTVAVGLNNCGTGGQSIVPNDLCVPGGSDMTPAHAQAWAQMVSQIQGWSDNQGYVLTVTVASADDIEPGWNYDADTVNWVTQYHNYFFCGQQNCPSQVLQYDFGSCDGCSYVMSDGSTCTTYTCLNPQYIVTTTTGTVNWTWALTDTLFVAWGETLDRPVPEIYVDVTNALQWYGLSRFAYDKNHLPIRFQGTTTTTTGNSPFDGWEQLWNKTYADVNTRIDDIPWSTLIRYQ